MAHPSQQASHLASAIAERLVRLRDWWQQGQELNGLDRREFERIADDVHVTAQELRSLVALGPGATDALHARMQALGISRADIEACAHGVMQDLERTCAHCAGKGQCADDLARRPEDPRWRAYCPNADTLDFVAKARSRAV